MFYEIHSDFFNEIHSEFDIKTCLHGMTIHIHTVLATYPILHPLSVISLIQSNMSPEGKALHLMLQDILQVLFSN